MKSLIVSIGFLALTACCGGGGGGGSIVPKPIQTTVPATAQLSGTFANGPRNGQSFTRNTLALTGALIPTYNFAKQDANISRNVGGLTQIQALAILDTAVVPTPSVVFSQTGNVAPIISIGGPVASYPGFTGSVIGTETIGQPSAVGTTQIIISAVSQTVSLTLNTFHGGLLTDGTDPSIGGVQYWTLDDSGAVVTATNQAYVCLSLTNGTINIPQGGVLKIESLDNALASQIPSPGAITSVTENQFDGSQTLVFKCGTKTIAWQPDVFLTGDYSTNKAADVYGPYRSF